MKEIRRGIIQNRSENQNKKIKKIKNYILEIDDSSDENTDIILDQINKKHSTIKLLSEELGAVI
ncbi:MAG: hypothetical protein IPO04_11455 [Cytophagaceae bacterium]|nr:hypothetical protein [Cytophagaceae bacterium]